jgi:hypothetical protein
MIAISSRQLQRLIDRLGERHWQHSDYTIGWMRCQCDFGRALRELQTLVDRDQGRRPMPYKEEGERLRTSRIAKTRVNTGVAALRFWATY